jgi:hypothetical protein
VFSEVLHAVKEGNAKGRFQTLRAVEALVVTEVCQMARRAGKIASVRVKVVKVEVAAPLLATRAIPRRIVAETFLVLQTAIAPDTAVLNTAALW